MLLQKDFGPGYCYTYTRLDFSKPPPGGIAEILMGPDPRWWLHLFVKVKRQDDEQQGVMPFSLMPWMEEVCDPANGILSQKRIIMMKAREVASSTFWALVYLRRMLTTPGADMIIGANNEKNAVNLIRTCKIAVENLPERIRPQVGKYNETEIEFPGLKSHVLAISGNPGSARSERSRFIVGTEVAYWKDDESYMTALEGTLVKGGEMVLESTHAGQANVFHEKYFAEENDIKVTPHGWTKLFYGWWANPLHDADWLEQKRLSLPNNFQFLQDHPSTPAEAALGSADTYFDQETLARGQADVDEPLESRPIGKEGGDPGFVFVWRRPVPGREYVISADVAEGRSNSRGNPDWSVATVMDVRTKVVCAVVWCRLREDEYAQQLVKLGYEYNTAQLAPESNSIGKAVVVWLKEHKYPNLFLEPQFSTDVWVVTSQTREIGWRTTSATKAIALSELYAAMKAGDFRHPWKLFWEQARSLGANMKAMGSAHDDAVMSAAIANQAAKLWVPQPKGEDRRAERGADGRSWLQLPWSQKR